MRNVSVVGKLNQFGINKMELQVFQGIIMNASLNDRIKGDGLPRSRCSPDQQVGGAIIGKLDRYNLAILVDSDRCENQHMIDIVRSYSSHNLEHAKVLLNLVSNLKPYTSIIYGVQLLLSWKIQCRLELWKLILDETNVHITGRVQSEIVCKRDPR